MDEKWYSVSEAVRLIGVESHVLRYWEEELRIPIQRTSQGHRIYSEKNVETFRRVREWKQKGIQLKAIRLLLEEKSGLEEALYTVAYKKAEGAFTEEGSESSARRPEPGKTGQSKCTGQKNPEPKDPEPKDRSQQETVYEIIQAEEPQNDTEKVIQLLKQMMEEVVGEQNQKLEQQLIEQLREELELLYLQYIQTMQEAAVSREKRGGILKQLFGRLFSGKE